MNAYPEDGAGSDNSPVGGRDQKPVDLTRTPNELERLSGVTVVGEKSGLAHMTATAGGRRV